MNGTLPDELYGTTSLRVLNLASNEFGGEISTKIGDLEDLTDLELQYNKFEGAIPSTLASLDEIKRVDLSFNLFTGSMPSEVCDLRGDSFLFVDLVSDCGGSPAQVSCDCCSTCEPGYT
uniref:Uncharacterized protein n=1 Tax=Helicotheca tamesis TaxID=374047 RepID=A0A7S2MHX1_9STRA